MLKSGTQIKNVKIARYLQLILEFVNTHPCHANLCMHCLIIDELYRNDLCPYTLTDEGKIDDGSLH